MEVDKNLATVERLLADFKQLGISRDEPVLIVGGGVLGRYRRPRLFAVWPQHAVSHIGHVDRHRY